MRIDIATFHNTLNFGATLQCYALATYLQSLGHEVEVVDYLPQYVMDKKSPWKELKKVKGFRNLPKGLLKGLLYASHAKGLRRKNAKFEEFINSSLKLSARYHSEADVEANPPQADFFICGSDQIWNPVLTGGRFDNVFFLTFAGGTSKASYGASMGEIDVKERKEELSRLTASYKGISLREKSTARELSEVLGKAVHTVLDCTLLLSMEDYRAVECPVRISDEPYLLLYNIQNSSASVTIAKRIAKEKNLLIVDISPNPFAKQRGFQKLIDIGPREFLYLFHHASYVVTNSFHGTAFSIIYQKQFVAIPHAKRAGRTMNLLEIAGLTDRCASGGTFAHDDLIDYANISPEMDKQRRESREYLDFILND